MRSEKGKYAASMIWRFISEACTICVLLSFFLFLLMEATKGNTQPGMPLSQFGLILLFSLVIALANRLFLLRLPLIFKLLLHYAATGIGIFTICSAAKKLTFSTPASLFAAVAIFTLLYAVLAMAVLFITHFLKKGTKTKQAEQPYEKRF